MSLRWFHLVFLLCAMIVCDLFGAWAVWSHSRTGETATLAAGVLSFLVGLGIAGYAIWVVTKLNRAKVE